VADLFRQRGAGGGSGVPSHHEQVSAGSGSNTTSRACRWGMRCTSVRGDLRRHEAAGGYCPGAGDEAESAAAG
jgi:hypothetical protein